MSSRFNSPSIPAPEEANEENPHSERTLTGLLQVTQTGVGFLHPSTDNSSKHQVDSVLLRPALARQFFHGDTIVCQAYLDEETGRWVARSATRKLVRPAFIARVRKVNEHRFEAIPLDGKIRHLFFSASQSYVAHCLYCIEPVIDNNGNDKAPFVSFIGTDQHHSSFLKAALIEHKWPDTQHYKLNACDQYVSKARSQQYKDLRQLPFVTVDGQHALERDDAVFVEACDEGFILWVAITDVSRYVKPHGPVDMQARDKGKSLYLPHYQSPMLPSSISYHECSLTAGKVQSAIVCRILLTRQGEVINSAFIAAEICVHHNLSYDDVDRFVLQPSEHYSADVCDSLLNWSILASNLHQKQTLRSRRFPRYQLPQALMDLNGEIVGFEAASGSAAKQMVETAIFEANHATGVFLHSHGLGLFRCQLPPDHRLLQDTLSLIGAEIGFKLHEHDTIEQVYGRVSLYFEKLTIKHLSLLSRCFMRSCYRTADSSTDHFMMGISNYATATSPLRQYADLLNQRLLKHAMGLSPLAHDMLQPAAMADFALQCNAHDKVVSEIEQTFWDLAYHHYLRKLDGQTVSCTICKIRPSSVRIQINGTGVTVDLNTYHYRQRPVFNKHTCSISLPDGSVFHVGDQIECRVDFASSGFYPLQWVGMKEKCSTTTKQMV